METSCSGSVMHHATEVDSVKFRQGVASEPVYVGSQVQCLCAGVCNSFLPGHLSYRQQSKAAGNISTVADQVQHVSHMFSWRTFEDVLGCIPCLSSVLKQ